MKTRKFLPVGIACAAVFLAIGGSAQTANDADVPVVDGGLGACKADFTVKDGEGKPIYNAKINVLIKYGFFSMRKTQLEAGTNSEGKARFTGLPERVKKPLEFVIKSGNVSSTVTDDPGEKCEAVFDVKLTER
ncbi:MAG TPA: hypothetical protein VLV88_14640 [Terriglobales bacterium]|nr:hypothetical protein [Terriglobales bacterium]